MKRVVILSNDVVPGLMVPTAAPGLRAFGLAQGLRAHGIETLVTVPVGIIAREWAKQAKSQSWPTPHGVVCIEDGKLKPLLQALRPDAVVMINSNKQKQVEPRDGLRIVYDFFAPKMLELTESHRPNPEAVERLTADKLEGIGKANAFIVNGRKKLPYVREWLARVPGAADKPVEVVNMPVTPVPARPARPGDADLRIVMAGYFQPWMRLGASLEAVRQILADDPSIALTLAMPTRGAVAGHPDMALLDALRRAPGTRSLGSQLYPDFRDTLADCDLFIDLFLRSPERELAMVTRTVVALSCGLPVIHPDFSEVTPLIQQYDAGWCVDPDDRDSILAALREATRDRELLAAKRANARALAEAVFHPRVAVEPLARLVLAG